MQIVSYGVTPEIRREHVISYSRNIHMNLCFKKKHKKTGWFSMCEVLKINTPAFSGHLTSLLLSFLPKSPKVYSFKDDQTCFSFCKLKVKDIDSKGLWSIINNSREEQYLQQLTFDLV